MFTLTYERINILIVSSCTDFSSTSSHDEAVIFYTPGDGYAGIWPTFE